MKLLLITLLPLSSLAGPAPFFPSSLPLPAPGLVQYAEVAALQYPDSQPGDYQRNLDKANTRQGSRNAGSVCLSESCVTTAASLLEQMDRTADPCVDFNRFTCGGFIDKHRITLPAHKTRISNFDLLSDKLKQDLKKVFEAEPQATEPRIYQEVRNAYSACMDTERIEDSSVADLKEMLARLGGWPVLEGDSWDDEGFTWWDLSMRAAREGMGTSRVISIGYATDAKNSERRITEVDQLSPGLSREYLIKGFEDKDVQAYYKLMVDMAVLLGAEEEAAKTEMEAALRLELQLVELALPKEERRNKTALYNPMPLRAVQEMYPELPLVEYVNGITLYEPANVDEDEIVNVAVLDYVPRVRALLAGVPARVQANYIVWRNVKSSLSFLNTAALDHALEYSKVLTGKKQYAPRWERCVKSVAGLDGKYLYYYEGSLTNAVAAMYAKMFFKLEAKEKADEMVVNIRAEFKKMLDELDWMDAATKARAHVKADKITPHMAYPKEILDDGLINEFYEGLELNTGSYLKNYYTLKKFINLYYAKEYRKKIVKDDWRTHGGAAVVNAFYNPSENSIQFPAGILGGVFFDPERPAYMNYGAIGFVVGHEITHGFDDQGSQKDAEGNLVDWWEPETKRKYLEKAQCIIHQYGNYSVDLGGGATMNLNGVNTQGENIADNGGVKEALRAYLARVEQLGEEPVLPALPYTQRQLFWLSAASVWCAEYRPAALKNLILTDAHAPSSFRTNGPLSNMPEFAADWSCPLGSPMNPEKKCSVW